MERLVDYYIRNKWKLPEKLLEVKEIALHAYLDIHGALDITSCQVIEISTRREVIKTLITRWIQAVLTSRITTATLLN